MNGPRSPWWFLRQLWRIAGVMADERLERWQRALEARLRRLERRLQDDR